MLAKLPLIEVEEGIRRWLLDVQFVKRLPRNLP
jgi:hypothetical protein